MHLLCRAHFNLLFIQTQINIYFYYTMQKLQFYPDIETKFQHLITHMNDKNKITNDLINILKEVADLQYYYSNTLDKFANSISKLFVGKDPIKQILITLQRIISRKSQESAKLATQIKNDLIPHIQKSINVKAQQALKDKQAHVRNIRSSMQRKLRMFLANQNNFKRAVVEINSLQKLVPIGQKQKALQNYRKKQDQFSDTIDSYNSSLQDYMLKYSQICEELSELQTNRKLQFRDSLGQLIVHQMQYLKGLQYDFAKYADSLKKMEGRLVIQDRILGGNQQFYQGKQGGLIHLAKISNKNYIDSIVGKKKMNQTLLGQQLYVSQLKSKYPPGQISKQTYHNLAKSIFPIMNFIQKNNHTNLLIQIVFFSKDIVTSRGNLKTTLLNALLSHQLFGDQNFWLHYEKRLFDKITREQNVVTGDEQALQNNFSNVLQRDLTMLRNVEINSFITKVIQNVCEKSKLVIIVQPALPSQVQTAVIAGTNKAKKISKFKYQVFQ